ncbi:Cyclic di-GMP phosphodiesterase Gmr [Planctomycetes bacterium CA13]|uniref:Cyclic di-GMP phosphodiesterase Gmr n=1 Tax=Novipirellula herctigrandis TaxID=2527986 RepID=A0A5C5YZJ8_9BACT|nr:Cyclic di-GMP phosphodiesterase Gmr [Planctomycetes bacterium CA13]
MCIPNDPLRQLENLITGIEASVSDELSVAFSILKEQLVPGCHSIQRTEKTQAEAILNATLTIEKLEESLTAMRDELNHARKERDNSETKGKMMADAQAEAIVNSAEIISELEETKLCLKAAHEAERDSKIAAERLIGFGNILDESDNEIYIFDCQSLRFVFANQGARKNLGYTIDELREMTPVDIKPDLEMDGLELQLYPLRNKQASSLRFSTVHIRKDGTRYPVEVHLHRSIYEERPVFVAVILDTTEKVQAEEELRTLSVTVEQSPASVMITDLDGNIEYVNPMFTKVTGISRDQALAQDCWGLLANMLPTHRCKELRQKICAGEVWRGEIESKNQNGEPFWELASISPIRNASGDIIRFLATFQDVTYSKMLMQKMEHLAFHDSLTGLPNRSSILQTIQRAIDSKKRSQYAVLFMDFDRFKLINDSLGHKAGDELLRQMSERLRRSLRNTDHVAAARLGGDEFVVFLNNLSDLDRAGRVAERLLQTFSESYQLCGNTVHSTVSIGIVTNEQQYQSANDMLRDADLAMYEAKSQGRGCYALFDQSMHERAETRMRIEGDLRMAIQRDEFVLHYQPIVDLESGHLEGVETLVRWNNRDRGLVQPNDFISIAEETRLIIPIGEWILKEACRQFAEWRRTLGEHAPPCFHVNASRLQMLNPGFVEMVTDCLYENDIPSQCLHLEITESVLIQEPGTIVRTLDALRDVGVLIDIDDFGTGYSSLSCLHEFPIDVLKIDRVFVNNMRSVKDAAALLHVILTLADDLDLQVIAEGVETPEQLATLQSMGCQYAQGFFFSKPLAVDEFEAFAMKAANGLNVVDSPATPALFAGYQNTDTCLIPVLDALHIEA